MAVIMTPPYMYFTDDNGDPLAGGKVFSYAAGTLTPQATYTDSTGATPNANPVRLDAAGRASIWLVGTYKFIVKDANDVTIRTTDNQTSFATTTGGTYTDSTLAGTTTLPGVDHYIDPAGSISCASLTATSSNATIVSTDGSVILRLVGRIGNGYMGTTSNHPVIIQTNNTPAVTIDVNQNSMFARYFTWSGQQRTTASFSKTADIAFADIPLLSVNVVAGSSYYYEANLYTTSNTTGAVKAQISGTATATAVTGSGTIFNGATAATTQYTALNTSIPATGVTAAYIRITGTIVVNAGGTLTVQFAQNASNATPSVVLAGSTFLVQLIP